MMDLDAAFLTVVQIKFKKIISMNGTTRPKNVLLANTFAKQTRNVPACCVVRTVVLGGKMVLVAREINKIWSIRTILHVWNMMKVNYYNRRVKCLWKRQSSFHLKNTVWFWFWYRHLSSKYWDDCSILGNLLQYIIIRHQLLLGWRIWKKKSSH